MSTFSAHLRAMLDQEHHQLLVSPIDSDTIAEDWLIQSLISISMTCRELRNLGGCALYDACNTLDMTARDLYMHPTIKGITAFLALPEWQTIQDTP